MFRFAQVHALGKTSKGSDTTIYQVRYLMQLKLTQVIFTLLVEKYQTDYS